MRHTLSLLSLVLVLAACTPQTGEDTGDTSSSSSSSSATESVLSVALENSSVTDDTDGIVRTTATLQLSGALEESVDLGDIQGELFAVENAADAETGIVAVLTAWFAGQGEEIVITHANDTLTVSHIYGDESGFCTEPETIAEFALPAGTEIELGDFGVTVEQSSLAFCHEEAAE